MAGPLLGVLLRGLLRAGAGGVGQIVMLTARGGGKSFNGGGSGIPLRKVGKLEDNQAEALRLALLFRRYLRIYLRENLLRLKEKSPFAMVVQKQRANRPLVNTGALIQKYVKIQALTNGFVVGFDLRRTYDGASGPSPLRDLLSLLEGGATIGRNPENKKKAARWMAIQLRKAGFPKMKSRKRFYKIPARPFFERVAEKFIRDNRDSSRKFRVSGWKLYIYVNRKGNRSTGAVGLRGGAEG